MSEIEVLAPLRIETRFIPPDAPGGGWLLRLRVYPDAASMAAPPAPPTHDELDQLDALLAAPFAEPPGTIESAFPIFADQVGPPRAVWLLATVGRIEVDGVPRSDRTGARARDEDALPAVLRPMGLPPRLGVFLVPAGGGDPAEVGAMVLDRVAIAADLDLSVFLDTPGEVPGSELPKTWWTSFARALEVGLATEIDLGHALPAPEALVVCGLGDTGPEALFAAHAASGRFAILASGTPTNTVDGELTTDLGRDPAAWLPLVGVDPAAQPAAVAVLAALGAGGAARSPVPGGALDPAGHGPALVAALWPVLWGRFLRDEIGALATPEIADWAVDHLAPEGPYPAIRLGAQPYGILPVTPLAAYVPDGDIDARLRDWTAGWAEGAAAKSEAAGTALGASTERLTALLGETAPTRAWGARPLGALAVIRAQRVAAGRPDIGPTAWEVDTGRTLADLPGPLDPLAGYDRLFPLPPPPRDAMEKADILFEMLSNVQLAFREQRKPLGLLGHLMREAALILAARAGTGVLALAAGQLVEADPALPPDLPPDDLRDRIFAGSEAGVETLRQSGDPGAQRLAKAFDIGMERLRTLLDRWKAEPDAVFAALLATLDTQSHRVDPWVIGLADARLRLLSAGGAPVWLGAFGWVDRPAPATGGPGSPLAPGPTAAGLLHAPSYPQALTSALLRDAAVRYPGDDRWRMGIDSARTRAAARLAERVRLGVHVYEALGLEVERLAGDWNLVRVLRAAFPMREAHEGRRCCDGARVLAAVLRGSEPLPAGLDPGLGARIAPLDAVLDTYADLLMADGVHALVSGDAGVGNAAMEAAAGLGAPPELRAIRTPRASAMVRVSAWALVPAAAPGAGLASRADPAFAALVDDEIGDAGGWMWTAGGVPVGLGDAGITGLESVDLAPDALEQALRQAAGVAGDAPVVSAGGAERLAAAGRLADVLGGGDGDPLSPGLDSGRDDARAADSPLRAAMLADLLDRLAGLKVEATTLRDTLAAADPEAEPDAGLAADLAAWRLSETDVADARLRLAARLAAVDGVRGGVAALRLAIRTLVARPRLPVLPIVARAALPDLDAVPKSDDGRPETDARWLEIVAAARPRLALLEARQLDPGRAPWPAAIATRDGSGDPWTALGPVVVAYGPGVGGAGDVAVAGLDAYADAIPARSHTTSAAFGFNGPKSRPPQALLIGVPPDPTRRMKAEELAATVMEARRLAHARALGPSESAEKASTPSALISASTGFQTDWWPE
jgi:hypothetical protein